MKKYDQTKLKILKAAKTGDFLLFELEALSGISKQLIKYWLKQNNVNLERYRCKLIRLKWNTSTKL